MTEGRLKALEATTAGDTFPLRLLTSEGTEIDIVVDVSAIDVSELVIRIEGATTHGDGRAKVIAQVFRGDTATSAGYAELLPIS